MSGTLPVANLFGHILPALAILSYAGTAVFALSGALIAAQERQTLVTFFFFAVITGIGGGTTRDLLIGAPVFWRNENWSLLICGAAAVAVWLSPARIWGGKALLWCDALGLAAYATYGAAKGLSFGVAPLPAFGVGVFTACAGGILRDVLAGQPSILMRPELYVTAAALSSGLMVMPAEMRWLGLGAAAFAAFAGFALRAVAILTGASLPSYRK